MVAIAVTVVFLIICRAGGWLEFLGTIQFEEIGFSADQEAQRCNGKAAQIRQELEAASPEVLCMWCETALYVWIVGTGLARC